MMSTEPLKVLAIDDDREICLYIQTILERQNVKVSMALNAEDALAMMNQQSYDTVLTDVRLPKDCGVTLLKKTRLAGNNVPFIVISGYTDQEPLISCLRLGATDYLSKPFSKLELEEAFQRALAQKRRQDWTKDLIDITDDQSISSNLKIQKHIGLIHSKYEAEATCLIHSENDKNFILFNKNLASLNTDRVRDIFERHIKPDRSQLDSHQTNEVIMPADLGSAEKVYTWTTVHLPKNAHQTNQLSLLIVRDSSKPQSFDDLSLLQLTAWSLGKLFESEELSVVIANQQSVLQSAQRLTNLGEMAATIVHEIENHLTIISGRSIQLKKLIGSHSKSEETKLLQTVESIQSDVKRIDRIVKSVRSLALIENSSFQKNQSFKIAVVIEEGLELFRLKAKLKSINIIAANPWPAISLQGHATQILQILLILFNNSYDAIESHANPWLQVDAMTVDGFVVIIVTDSGSGISKEIEDKIFDAFFTTKHAGQGLGVGLNLALRYAKNHGGSIEIDKSCPNTRFVVRLPIPPT